MATNIVRTLSNESRIEELLDKPDDVKWDVVGFSEVRRTREAFILLQVGHI